MKKPLVRPPKKRTPKIIKPTLAENIAIMRGIAADPDAREVTRKQMRRMRPFVESVVLHRIPHARRGITATAYLTGERRMQHYLDAASAAARDLKMPSIVTAANAAIERARQRIAISAPRPKA